MSEFVRILYDDFHGPVVADVKCFGNLASHLTYYLPDSLAYGDLDRIVACVPEEASDRLVFGESPGDGEGVVLQEGDRGVRYLSSEVAGLAFAEAEVLLAVLVNHLDSPSHGVNFVSPEEVEGGVRGDDGAPWGALAAANVEYPDRDVVKVSVDNDVIAPALAAVPHSGLLSGALGDDCAGGDLLPIRCKGEPHGLASHLHHAEIVALYAAGPDVADNLPAGEPAVSQKVVEPAAVAYGSSYHLYEKLDLASRVVRHPLCRGALSVALFAESRVEVCLAQGMHALLAGLADQLEVQGHLALAVAYGQRQDLVPEYHHVGDMAEYAADVLHADSSLRIVGVVNNQADRAVAMVGPDAHAAPKLAGYVAHDLAPVQGVVVHEPIEHVLGCAA